jgi:hypothetical protein
VHLKPLFVLSLVAGSALAKQHLAPTAAMAHTPRSGEAIAFFPGTLDVDHATVDLDALGTWLEALPEDATLQVEGYWCLEDRLPNTTTEELLEIAERRAVTTRRLLVDLGVSGDRVSAIAYGPHAGGPCQAVVEATLEAADDAS